MIAEITPALLDDIWECAAELHGDAKYKVEMYGKYSTSRADRYRAEVATAERVMEWVKEQRE